MKQAQANGANFRYEYDEFQDMLYILFADHEHQDSFYRLREEQPDVMYRYRLEDEQPIGITVRNVAQRHWDRANGEELPSFAERIVARYS